jgi:hypothetical protein
MSAKCHGASPSMISHAASPSSPARFETFRRRSNAAAPPGSGFGLSIAAAIANLHDFDLRFDDNHPGAVFEMAGRRKQWDGHLCRRKSPRAHPTSSALGKSN